MRILRKRNKIGVILIASGIALVIHITLKSLEEQEMLQDGDGPDQKRRTRQHYSDDSTIPTPPRLLKVLLLSSNPRSGSSYLAQILTPEEILPFYFFEPLRWMAEKSPTNNRRRRQMYSTTTSTTLSPPLAFDVLSPGQKVTVIEDFMECRFSNYSEVILSDYARSSVFRKPKRTFGRTRLPHKLVDVVDAIKDAEKNCRRAKFRLVKTIRLSLKEALTSSWVRSDPDVRVILLVRDPRAVANSVLKPGAPWHHTVASPRRICSNILENLEVATDNKKVLIVKFEDLVNFKIKIIQRILEFLGMQASLDLVLRDTRALARSARVPQMRPKQKKRKLGVKKIHQNSLIRQRNPEILDSSYFSVSRPKDYNFDSWKEDLNKRIRDDMARDEQCRSVLESLSYPEL